MPEIPRRIGMKVTPAVTPQPATTPTAPVVETPARAALRDSFANVPPQTVKKPESPADAQFLETLSRQTFRYFLDQADPITGLIKDRSTPDSPASTAAVGFGLSALVVGAQRGFISRDEAYDRSLKAVRSLEQLQASTPQFHGFLHHFIDMKTLEPWRDTEVSSIDTALMVAGMLHAAQEFPGTELATLANRVYDRIDWKWMLNGGETLSHGVTKDGFLPSRWEGHSEGLLLYVLALGSSTHPIPPESWKRMTESYEIRTAPGGQPFVATPTHSLFTYEYPQVWLDLRGKHDQTGVNYFENSRRAVQADAAFSKAQGATGFGVTASDGPDGYMNYGAQKGAFDGTFAPTGAGAAVPFAPELAIPALRELEQHDRLWGEYGPKDAYNLKRDWFAPDYLGIDQGAMLLMIANHQDDAVWKSTMKHPAFARGLERAGFTAG